MLRVPHNLPEELRHGLMARLSNSTLEGVARGISDLLLDLFSATHCLFVLRPQSAGSERRTAVFQSQGDSIDSKEREAFLERWFDSGIDSAIDRELMQRLQSVSYSAYSWPFPSAVDRECSLLSLPQEYTVLIPISSALIVTDEIEVEFSGYVAILYDSFPELSEETIALVMTLPSLVSQLVATSQRRLTARNDELGVYGHDVKQYLLLNRELLKRLKNARDAGDLQGIAATTTRLSSASTRMLMQTNALLLSGREAIGSLRVNPFHVNLNELIEEACHELEPVFEVAGIKLSCEIDPNIPSVWIDPAIFPSVVHNLLDNALKYSDPGGTVLIRTYKSADGQACLEVSDQGIGILEEDLTSIYDKHYRGANTQQISGTGLGLYLVRWIVEAHDAEIELHDDQEVGVKFLLKFPEREDDRLLETADHRF